MKNVNFKSHAAYHPYNVTGSSGSATMHQQQQLQQQHHHQQQQLLIQQQQQQQQQQQARLQYSHYNGQQEQQLLNYSHQQQQQQRPTHINYHQHQQQQPQQQMTNLAHYFNSAAYNFNTNNNNHTAINANALPSASTSTATAAAASVTAASLSTAKETRKPATAALVESAAPALPATTSHMPSCTGNFFANQYNNLNYSNANMNYNQMQNQLQIQQQQQRQSNLLYGNAANNQTLLQQQQQQPSRQLQQNNITSTIAAEKTSASISKTPPPPTTTTTTTAAEAEATCDKFAMDACEIANFLANELFMQQLVSLDGIQSGVPTLTTPTLTPTTLRSIEESLYEMTNDPISAPYQAGFKPPPLAPVLSAVTTNNSNNNNNNITTSSTIATITTNNLNNFNSSMLGYDGNGATDSEGSQLSWAGAQSNGDNTTTDTSASAATDSSTYPNGFNNLLGNTTSNGSSASDFTAVIAKIAKNSSLVANVSGNLNTTNINSNTSNSATPAPTARRGGGRRPAKSTNMSPEEEEKRRVRRERNKLAAARCRKRRVDQTNDLLDEVAGLENKREHFQKEIESLTNVRKQLEFVLEAHRPTCQKVREDLLTVTTFNGLIAPTNNSTNSNDSTSATIIGLDPSLNSTGRSNSPLDLKPVLNDNLLQQIKHEPLDSALDSSSSLDNDGPTSPKRIMLSSHNPMVTPLPNIAALTASLTTPTGPSASLNTPIVSVAPVSFAAYANAANNNTAVTPTSHATAINALSKPLKQRPNSLPTVPRTFAQNLQLNVDGKTATEILGVPVQTPSTGMFNFDSLMDGGTGLTPVSGPLVPTCSSQNKHPLELPTPTSEPSKLVSL